MKQTFVVDTNVLLRYFYSDDKKQTALVTPYFENKEYQLVITSETLCELVWVLKKTMKIHHVLISSIILTLINSPNTYITNLSAVQFALKFLEHNGDFADGMIAYQTTQFDNAKLLTFDKNAQKLAKAQGIMLEDLS